ncbi:hypothetical protein R83H12_02808 [Fibrobacteria bacterium R8-3-H12]
MFMVKVFSSLPAPFSALTVNVYEPSAVGLPEMYQLLRLSPELLRLSPGGRSPLSMLNVAASVA